MSDPVFFRRASEPTLADIVTWTGARPSPGADLSCVIRSVAPLELAPPESLVFLDNPKYAQNLALTQAAACLLQAKFAALVPARTVALVTPEPYAAFATVVEKLFPESMRPQSVFGGSGIAASACVHPEARLEHGVRVDPGAVIGPRAEIGSGTLVGANTVIGADVRIGRGCSIGPNATIVYALIGDRVIVHAGVRIGQDGFGFAMGPRGHRKVPQVGRVIIQDDVEIGANSAIDRGANRDTVIGEGTKIDNLVQIAHNVRIGRHCVIVSQVGISGSCTLDDFVVVAGQAGLVGHLHIGAGAQIGAASGVMRDIPKGERFAGVPALPVKDWLRGVAILRKLAAQSGSAADGDTKPDRDRSSGG
jgi:UDP-3-O-[3-hydroxymyristoyl] glucosamine N-acyltransferase